MIWDADDDYYGDDGEGADDDLIFAMVARHDIKDV